MFVYKYTETIECVEKYPKKIQLNQKGSMEAQSQV